MQYTTLGRTGLQVSRLCLGTMNFGPETSEADSFKIMDRALELGINFFDTADVYGWKKGEGITEQILGRWFALGGNRREKTILATKVYNDMELIPGDITMRGRGLSAVKIRRAAEGSLKRMQTDYIDLYQMHHVHRPAAWEEIWQAFDVLIQQGKIVYTGSSNFAGWHLAAANEAAKRGNHLGLVSEQSKYSLMSRTIELEVLPAAIHYGMAVIPWSPLESGLLGGALEKLEKGRRASAGNQERINKERPRLQKWEDWCRAIGEKPADVALAWMLHHPAITAPIIGPRTLEQLEGSPRATEIKLTTEQLAQLDAIFPGPKGASENGYGDWTVQYAPEAYSW